MKHADAHGIYSTQATVRTYESGADGLMKPETVLHWFQEIAEAHASSLGFGYDFVISRGLAWVEVRLNTAISRLPRWKETVELLHLDRAGNAAAGAPQSGNKGRPGKPNRHGKLPVGRH